MSYIHSKNNKRTNTATPDLAKIYAKVTEKHHKAPFFTLTVYSIDVLYVAMIKTVVNEHRLMERLRLFLKREV